MSVGERAAVIASVSAWVRNSITAERARHEEEVREVTATALNDVNKHVGGLSQEQQMRVEKIIMFIQSSILTGGGGKENGV
jgi:hypothetical protein